MGGLIYLYSVFILSGIILLAGGIRSIMNKDDDKPSFMFIILGIGFASWGFFELIEII